MESKEGGSRPMTDIPEKVIVESEMETLDIKTPEREDQELGTDKQPSPGKSTQYILARNTTIESKDVIQGQTNSDMNKNQLTDQGSETGQDDDSSKAENKKSNLEEVPCSSKTMTKRQKISNEISHLRDWKYEKGEKFYLVVWKDNQENNWMNRTDLWRSNLSLVLTMEYGEEKYNRLKSRMEMASRPVAVFKKKYIDDDSSCDDEPKKQREDIKPGSAEELLDNATPEVLQSVGLHRVGSMAEKEKFTHAKETSTQAVPVIKKLDDGVFAVEYVMDYKKINDREHFFVKWANYPMHAATWEPLENLLPDCENLVETARAFYNKYGLKKKRNSPMDKLKKCAVPADRPPQYGELGLFPDQEQAITIRARAEKRKREANEK